MYFNSALNDLDRQHILVMSAIEPHDAMENEKIQLVARLLDRNFSLLHLHGCYDTNRFTESIIALNRNIRNQPTVQIQRVFDEQLLKDINEARSTNVDTPFQWVLFRESGNNLSRRFLRYFFGRVDRFISEETGEPTAGYHGLVRNTGYKNGHHIEHILADNEENKKLFRRDEDGGDEVFYRERNRLGALVLLQGGKNLSSGAETYEGKLQTYANGTIWAKTLTQNFHHANPPFKKFIQEYDLNIHPIEKYDEEAIEVRQRLLFQFAKILWGDADESP